MFSFLFYAYFWIFYCVLKFVVPFSQYFRHFTMWKFTQNPYFLGFLCNHLGLCYHYVLWLILILTHSGSTYLSPMGRKWSWYFLSHPRGPFSQKNIFSWFWHLYGYQFDRLCALIPDLYKVLLWKVPKQRYWQKNCQKCALSMT